MENFARPFKFGGMSFEMTGLSALNFERVRGVGDLILVPYKLAFTV